MEENFILSGPPYFPKYDKHKSFAQFIYERMLQSSRQDIALIDGHTEKPLKYVEFLQKTLKINEFFKKIGVKQNEVVSIVSENCLDFLVIALAILMNGSILSTINFLYSKYELHHCLNLSKPKLVFCSTTTSKNLFEIWSKNKYIEKVVIINDDDTESRRIQNKPNVILYKEIIKNYQYVNRFDFKFQPIDIDEHVALILNSSGTTGLPKGVMLTHKNLLVEYDFSKDPEVGVILYKCSVCFLPLYHAYGLIISLCALADNIKTIIMRRFEEELYLQLIEKYKCSHLFLVPPIILMLTKSQKTIDYDLSSLEEVFTGAAPLSVNLAKEFINKFKLKSFRQGYGMTETTLGVVLQPIKTNLETIKSVGKVILGVKCKVIDVKNGNILGPYQDGELCFKAPILMKGYINNKKATDEIIDTDGWLHSGDIGHYDNEGYIYIVDRLKELIKYKGYQVPPAELEALILQHPKVYDCGVVGKPDRLAGEKAVAFVVLKPNVDATEDEIKQFIAEQISPQKHLHGGVIFVNSIPKNPSGKILRRELRELLKKHKNKL